MEDSPQRDLDLLQELIALPAETTWLEFKQNNANPILIGKYCSAIANAARIEGKNCGYMLFGVDDASHKIIGTIFDPDKEKSNDQELEFWLAQRLKPSIAIQFRKIHHEDGLVVMLEIPAATVAPVSYDNMAYIRIGSTTPKLVDHPSRYQMLINAMQTFAWETSFAAEYLRPSVVLELLSSKTYFDLCNIPMPHEEDRILERLAAENIIVKDVGECWNITNMGAILFAHDFGTFKPSLARKAVRLVVYEGKGRASSVKRRIDGKQGYAKGFVNLAEFINEILPSNEQIGVALRENLPLFPQLAVRELIANALIHQDMTITGAGPLIEVFSDRIEITNPGEPLNEPDRMIDLPPRSRNEALAALMRRMGFCEEQGTGLDKVVTQVELYQLPPPLFKAEGSSTQVVLNGPRSFANMTKDERLRACYQHAILKYLSGERMKNASLCERFGIETKNAAQASNVIAKTLEADLIKPADVDHPRAGYIPIWA